MWHTWFDRDLTLAGRIIIKDDSGFKVKLWSHKNALVQIPTLAIHLRSQEEKEKFGFNKETHLKPIIASSVVDSLFNETE